MAQKDKNDRQDAEMVARGEALLDEALLVSGAKIPTTVEEVAIVEAACEDDIPLPTHLGNAADFFSFKPGENPLTRRPNYDERAKLELARVAREGASITPEIEARMKAAREEADHEHDDDGSGPAEPHRRD